MVWHRSSFEQYCDFSRQFDPAPSPKVLPDGTTVPVYTGPGVDTFVAEFGRVDLLDFSRSFCAAYRAMILTAPCSEQVLGQPGPAQRGFLGA